MKRAIEIIGKSVLILLVGAGVGTILLVMAYMLPVNIENRDASYETLEQEGWYPRATVTSRSLDTYFHSYFPDVLDDSTDKIMLYTAMDDSVGSPLIRAMESYSDYVGSYSYYWHGYVVLLRVFFLFLNYTELRAVNGACQLLLVLVLATIVGREKGVGYVFMLATSYVLLSSIALSLGLQFSWVFYIAYIGTLIFLLKMDFFEKNQHYVFFFMVLGMFTSYFDLLTYPLATWGVPLIWWMVMTKREEKEGFWTSRVVFSGFSWIAGYAFMWIMKWVIATLVLRQNVFESALNEVFFRTGLQEEEYFLSERLQAIYVNWKHYEYKVYEMILIAWLIWWICSILLKGWRRDSRRQALLLTGVSSIVWYFVLSNHTQGHHFFTYRIYSISVLAFMAIALTSVSDMNMQRAVIFKGRMKAFSVMVVAGGVSLFLMSLARESIAAQNVAYEFHKIALEAGGSLEVSFSPAFSEIKKLNLGLECEGKNGYCEIKLWDVEDVIYQEKILLENFNDGNYQGMDVRWKLDSKKKYRLTLEVDDIVEPVYVWVTENGAMPLTEYEQLSINSQSEEGQLLTGITYWALPTSRKTQIFIAMTWMGVLLSVAYALWPCCSKISVIEDISQRNHGISNT